MFRSLLRSADVQLSCAIDTNTIRLILFQLILILTHAAVQVTQYLITPRENSNSFILLIGLYIVCISKIIIRFLSFPHITCISSTKIGRECVFYC